MDEITRQAARQWTVAQPVVSAFVTSVVRDFSARDDVLQEVAVAVIESYGRYDTSRPFVAWALGIAHNHVGLYLRRMKRDRHIFDEETVSQLAAAFSEVSTEQSMKLDRLSDCLKGLDGRAKQLCEMRYQQDLKPAAIADVVGMTANSVAKALQRIRDQLRLCIEQRTTESLSS
ncbi:MAG: sigma-70 family RNA polymerase sigma factor [Planctomycetota bacterium]